MSIIFINIIYLKLVDIFLKMFIKLLTFLFKKNYCISIIEISITSNTIVIILKNRNITLYLI